MSTIKKEAERALRDIAARFGASFELVHRPHGRHEVRLLAVLPNGNRVQLPVVKSLGRRAGCALDNALQQLKRELKAAGGVDARGA